ncbi:hypothetical protein WQQ_25060 [Hydrocarboniphaga effusa AP103]|uniref:Uncharacterized protein n=1 Tax=Hydrocarboniphaga effusa AP103 TaxID=1172194 RepID=I7ZAN3_9GAMM|nr:hypothetical protein WQQ_25060 [Hydrocarboniphaga effusa AP103]
MNVSAGDRRPKRFGRRAPFDDAINLLRCIDDSESGLARR